MLSIGSNGQSGKSFDSAVASNAYGGRRALPRFLRKPARAFNRLISGNLAISKNGWMKMAVSAGVIALTAVFVNSRQGSEIIADVSANLGFSIESVAVEGTKEISRIDILSRLELNFEDGQPKSLFSFDVKKARVDLGKISWVKSVVVSKAYPDRLVVRIVERQPFAIWQNGEALDLVETGGKPIDSFDERFGYLPLLVGEGANVHGADIIYQTSRISVLNDKIKAYVRIGDRRWDLHLKNGMNVRLPADGLGLALLKLSQLDKSKDLLSRELAVVDLRLKDRLVVSLSKVGSEMMAAQSKARLVNKQEGKI